MQSLGNHVLDRTVREAEIAPRSLTATVSPATFQLGDLPIEPPQLFVISNHAEIEIEIPRLAMMPINECDAIIRQRLAVTIP